MFFSYTVQLRNLSITYFMLAYFDWILTPQLMKHFVGFYLVLFIQILYFGVIIRQINTPICIIFHLPFKIAQHFTNYKHLFIALIHLKSTYTYCMSSIWQIMNFFCWIAYRIEKSEASASLLTYNTISNLHIFLSAEKFQRNRNDDNQCRTGNRI